MVEPTDAKHIDIVTTPRDFSCEKKYVEEERATHLLFTFYVRVPDQVMREGAFESLEKYMAGLRIDLDETIQRWRRENA
jgi:hypothetical protein